MDTLYQRTTRSANKKVWKSRRGSWLFRVLTRSVLVICLVTLAVFFVIRLVPGDPAVMVLGEHADEAALEAMREELGLNKPLHEQFDMFLRNIVTRLDTGDSIKYGISCRELIFRYAPVTLALCLLSAVITAAATLVLAFLAARHEGGILDHVIRIIPAFTAGMPVFWVGLMLILCFSVRLGWFPVGGTGDGSTGSFWHSLVLPAVTISIGQVPPLVRSLRERLLEIMKADFVLTLRAAGMPEGEIFRRHVLKNAFVPTLMLFSVNFSYLIGGTIVIEKVFAVRGIGRLLFDAISNRDFPLVQAITLYIAVFVVLLGLAAELIAERVDPHDD